MAWELLTVTCFLFKMSLRGRKVLLAAYSIKKHVQEHRTFLV